MSTRAARPPVAPEVARARAHLMGLFLLLGLTISSWLARLPTVRADLDLSTGALGTVMLLGAVGALVSGLASGAVVARFGGRRTLIGGSLIFSVSYVLLGVGPTVGQVGWLVAGVVGMTASFALMSVPMNVETVVIERRLGRTVVPQFHAAFSIGAVLGSVLGALASWAQVPVVVQFALVSIGALLWRMHAVPRALLTSPEPVVRTSGLRGSLGAWRERRTVLIGVVVAAAALSEGSANNWLTIAVVDGFGASEATAAVVFGLFVASMTAARLAGTWAIDRFGRLRVLVGSGLATIGGVVAFGTSPALAGSVGGVIVWGLGAGLIIPIGMAAVSQDPLRAPARVAVLTSMTSMVSIAAPPVIGFAADAMGARHALLLITVGLLAGLAASRAVRQAEPARPATRRPAGKPAEARPELLTVACQEA